MKVQWQVNASLTKLVEKMDGFMRSQIVLQRDQAEATGALTAAIKELTNLTKSRS